MRPNCAQSQYAVSYSCLAHSPEMVGILRLIVGRLPHLRLHLRVVHDRYSPY